MSRTQLHHDSVHTAVGLDGRDHALARYVLSRARCACDHRCKERPYVKMRRSLGARHLATLATLAHCSAEALGHDALESLNALLHAAEWDRPTHQQLDACFSHLYAALLRQAAQQLSFLIEAHPLSAPSSSCTLY